MVLRFLRIQQWRWIIAGLLLPVWAGATTPILDPVKHASAPIVAVLADSDGDGIADEQDLCPGTPSGTPVNAYGCPKTTATCDYNTASITLASTGGSGGGTVRYVLADSLGTLLQVSATPTFSGLVGRHTYMALAIRYEDTATGLTAGQPISAVTASCYDWSEAVMLTVCASNDADGDGVPDERDLCAGTPAGMPVNAYGCPKTKTACDYTTANITLSSTGITGNGTVQYVLADSTGTILQVNATPSFSGLGGSHTYMALAISYDGPITGLTVGQPLTGVNAGCYDWSDALVLKVCVPASSTCDYTLGETITLLSGVGGLPAANSVTRYLLVNSAGVMVRINTTPVFATTGLLAGTYTAYALIYTDDQSLVNLETGRGLTTVQANCMALSTPLTLVLCQNCGTKCIPLVITKKRR